MQSSNRKIVLAAVAAACLGLLAACASHGNRAGDAPQFPDPATATFTEGSYPNVDNLRAIAPGMTKDQLYALVGRPHYHEGVFGVRQWDYLFNFRSDDGGASACQYQVQFDDNERVRATYWKPTTCAGFLLPEEDTVTRVIEERKVILSADVLFDFAGAELTPLGRRALDDAVGQLQGGKVERVEVTGHADRIGSDAANDLLSHQRAQAVRDYLQGRGVSGNVIVADGRGEREPVVQCHDASRADLVACLAPNRRVEVLIRLAHSPSQESR